MKPYGNLQTPVHLGCLAGALFAALLQMGSAVAQQRAANIHVPKLSEKAQVGKVAFDRTCAACHGKNASGTDKGPPFIHMIYNPGHHGDAAFYNAVRRGSPQHHWRFGNMPPQPHVTDREVGAIIH